MNCVWSLTPFAGWFLSATLIHFSPPEPCLIAMLSMLPELWLSKYPLCGFDHLISPVLAALFLFLRFLFSFFFPSGGKGSRKVDSVCWAVTLSRFPSHLQDSVTQRPKVRNMSSLGLSFFPPQKINTEIITVSAYHKMLLWTLNGIIHGKCLACDLAHSEQSTLVWMYTCFWI